jgi:GNAT superfamily N-acetyltransferase
VTFTSVAFDPEVHDVAAFGCGEPSLDEWLLRHAAAESRRGSARVWVWVDETSTTPTRVMGYYSLSAGKVARQDLPKALGRGGPSEVPAVLIGRLALDASRRGQGLGELLLADALSRIVDATRTVGARFVVVDALHEPAALFYERHGFRRLPDRLLLVQKVADIQAAHDA